MVLDEVPATCHPLGRRNKLIFAPGIMSGSPAADSGRLSAGAKSPLTNFRNGRFEHAQAISGETMAENIQARSGITTEGCHPGCVIRCSNVYHDKDNKYLTSGFEYETIWAFGAHCMVKDLDDIATMDRLCDDFGLDTIEMGVALGIAMEGGMIPWGDGKAAINLLSTIGEFGIEGKIIGNGAAYTGDALGVDRVPVVKKQALPAYDPRACKGVGVTYATTPMGADHTAGYGVTANILAVGVTVDPLKKEGNMELSQGLQVATAAVDAAELYLFVAFAVLDNDDALPTIAKMINAQCGLALTPDDIIELGKDILRNEKEFNKRAGFTEVDDQLPEMFLNDAELPPHNVTWDFTREDLKKTLDF